MTIVATLSALRAPSRHAVGWWLVALALLVALMVTIGGLTRLTGSGLSITEWKPVTGVVPPLTHDAWQSAFVEYQQIPQYRFENRGMSLAQFQTIYWWEWTHRLLGRLLALVFLFPFVFFAATGAISRKQWPRMLLLFALGGLQGAVGWWMVQSGLETRVSVSQYRLAIHLGVALLLFGALFWTALEYFRESFPPPRDLSAEARSAKAEAWGRGTAPVSGRRPARGQAPRWRGQQIPSFVLVALVYLQMLLGAIVAGLHAGLIYNTWPSMDGRVFPEGAFSSSPWWINVFENAGLAQFDHRLFAYIAAASALALWIAVRRSALDRAVRVSSDVLAAIVLLQVTLGIVTLLNQAPLVLAALHQATAVALFGVALWNAFEMKNMGVIPAKAGTQKFAGEGTAHQVGASSSRKQ